MNTIGFRYMTDETAALLLNNYRREITSCSRTFYNTLKKEPELKSQFEYQKKGSVLINPVSFDSINIL